MILWIDEFDNAHEVTELDSGMIEALNDGYIIAYRFDPTTGHYQRHDGNEWMSLEAYLVKYAT